MQLLSRVIKSDWVREGRVEELKVRVFKSVERIAPEIEKEVNGAKIQACSILREAEEQAKQLLEAAQKQAQELIKQSEETGYQAGYQKSLKDAAAEAEEIRRQAGEVLKAAHWEKQQIIKNSQAEIRRLLCQLTERLMLKELETDKEAVYRLVEHAISKCAESRGYQVYVHPEEVEAVRLQKEELSELLPIGASLALIPDPTVNQGCCRVLTENSVIDATLGTRLEGLKQFLREREEQ